jgi:hypothetical protein
MGVRSPYHLSEEERHIAQEKHHAFIKEGVMMPVPKREKKGYRGRLQPVLSSAFTIVKYKAKKGEAAIEARKQWGASHPGEVVKFIAREKGFVPPSNAFVAKWRVVYDFKALNAATLKLPMSYGKQDEAYARIKPGDTMFVLDVQDGFSAIPVCKMERSNFWVMTDQQPVLEAQRMPFGYRLAPYFFCLFSGTVAMAVQSALGRLARTHMYMDDLLVTLSKQRRGDHARAVNEAIQVMGQCGAAVSLSKLEGPAHSVTYLGLQLTAGTTNVTLSMPEDKWFTLRELFKLVEATESRSPSGLPTLSKGAIDSLVGKLGALATFLPLSKPALARLYALKRDAGDKWNRWAKISPVPLTAKQHASLELLMNQVRNAPVRDIGGGPAMEPLPIIFGAVDASGEGGLGGHLRRTGSDEHVWWSISVRVPGAQAGDEWIGLSTLLELWAIKEAVQQAKKRWKSMRMRICLAVDSQAAASLLRKGYSTRCEASNATCEEIEEMLGAGDIRVTLVWVQRQYNWRADQLSHPGVHHHKWLQDLPQHTDDLTEGQGESHDTPSTKGHTPSTSTI